MLLIIEKILGQGPPTLPFQAHKDWHIAYEVASSNGGEGILREPPFLWVLEPTKAATHKFTPKQFLH
jgi:hypothetical protein